MEELEKREITDIREREWLQRNTDASKVLNLLKEVEDILFSLDEYQMNNGQCYPDIEDMLLEIGFLRAKYTDFVDKNIEVLNIK